MCILDEQPKNAVNRRTKQATTNQRTQRENSNPRGVRAHDTKVVQVLKQWYSASRSNERNAPIKRASSGLKKTNSYKSCKTRRDGQLIFKHSRKRTPETGKLSRVSSIVRRHERGSQSSQRNNYPQRQLALEENAKNCREHTKKYTNTAVAEKTLMTRRHPGLTRHDRRH